MSGQQDPSEAETPEQSGTGGRKIALNNVIEGPLKDRQARVAVRDEAGKREVRQLRDEKLEAADELA